MNPPNDPKFIQELPIIRYTQPNSEFFKALNKKIHRYFII